MLGYFKIYKILMIVVYALLFVLGLLYAVAPRWSWKTLESWRATREPTKAFFVIRRICGIVIMIATVAAAFLPTWMNYFSE